MDFCVRTVLLIFAVFFLTGMIGVCIAAFMFKVWLLGVLLSLSTIFAFLPVGLCIKKWVSAKERRRLGKRERKRLRQAKVKYHNEISNILMGFISSMDMVNIICDQYLDEVEEELIITMYNIKTEYLVEKY